MAVKLFWTPRARADVKKIYLDIGREQPASAEGYLQRIRAKVERLASHPRLGERRPEIYPSVRMLVEAPYVILYETIPDSDEGALEVVEIVRIVDGRRDLKALF